MLEFVKTTSIDFHKYGHIASTIELKKSNNNYDYYSFHNKSIKKMHKSNNETMFVVNDGIVLLLVSKSLKEKPEAFFVHRICKLDSDLYFNFISVSDTASVDITGKCLSKSYKCEPFSYAPVESKLIIKNILSSFYMVRGSGYHFLGETHRFWELTYLDTGELDTCINDKNYTIKANQAIFYSPNQFHDQNTKMHCSYLTIIFEMDIPEEMESVLKNRIFTISNQYGNLLKDFIQIKLYKNDHASDVLISDLYCFIMHILLTEKEKTKAVKTSSQVKYQNELLDNIIVYINDNIYDDLSIDKICRTFALSRSSIQLMFKNQLKITPKAYIEEVRFNKARQLIKDSMFSISEIAVLCGFSSIHYFSRKFKERYNVSPRDYARSIS